MSKNNLSKILTKLTILGAAAGALFAIYSKFKKRKTTVLSGNTNTQAANDDDFDFDEIDKDSREYVSININERKKQPNDASN